MRQPSETVEKPPRRRGERLWAAALGPPARTPLGWAAQVSLQLLLVAAAIALVGFILLQLQLLVLPVLIALFLASVLMPVSDWLKRRGLTDALAALVVLVVAVAIIAGAIALLAPPVGEEIGALGESVRRGLTEIGSALQSIGVSQEEIDQAIDQALQTLRDNSGLIGQSVVTGAILLIEVVAGVLLTLVVLFFLLKDGGRIWAWLVELLPARRHGDAQDLGSSTWWTLSHYLRGVALVALLDGVLIGLGLAILSVPLVLPLAVLTFFGGFFPLVGAITAGFVAALVALVSNGPVTALIVVGIILAVQQLEGNVIYPFVVGRQIRLHPLAILLAVTAGAVVAGIVGALFAAPLVAVVWTVLKHFRREGGPMEVATADGEG